MATFALGAVGTAVGGPFGGFIGATVGSLIDNFLLFPLLFPQQGQKGPRMEGVNVSSGTEGSPIDWYLGPRVAVGAKVEWMSEIEEVENEVGGKGGGPSSTTYDYYVDIALSFGDVHQQGFNRMRRIKADVKVIWDDGVVDGFYDDITTYDGSQTLPDPFLESRIGAGRVPAYTGRVLVVIQRLFLGTFGNRIPNFEAIAEQAGGMSYATAIAEVMERSGFAGSEYSVEDVRGCMRGVRYDGVVDGDSMLGPLLVSGGIAAQETDGGVRFFSLADAHVIDVDQSHLVSGDGDGGVSFKDAIERNAIDEVIVSYTNDDRELRPGSTPYRDPSRSYQRNPLRIDAGVTLTRQEAEIVAKREFHRANIERRGASLTLSSRYWRVCGGDMLRFSSLDGVGGESYVRVQRVAHHPEGDIEIEGVQVWPDTYEQVATSGSALAAPSEINRTVFDFVADMAAIHEAGTTTPSLYFGAASQDAAVAFRGVTLYAGLAPDPTALLPRARAGRRAALFEVISPPAPDATPFTWDERSTLQVRAMVADASLSDASDDEVLAMRRNVLAIRCGDEWEIVGFGRANAEGGGVYTLTRLIRGLRGTDHLIEQHAGTSVAVALVESGGGVVPWEAGTAFLGAPYYRIVPGGGSFSAADTRRTAFRGRSMRPFAPSHLEYVRRASSPTIEDVEVRWRRRTKAPFDPFGANDAPLLPDDNPAQYPWEVRRGGELGPVMASGIANEPYLVFTQGDRDAWAAANSPWTEGAGFTFKVWMRSAVVGDSPVCRTYIPARGS